MRHLSLQPPVSPHTSWLVTLVMSAALASTCGVKAAVAAEGENLIFCTDSERHKGEASGVQSKKYGGKAEILVGLPAADILAEIEKRVPQFTLITQNVDGLHRMAGSQNVLELHGNIQRVRCADCYTFTEIWSDDTEAVPQCMECGGLLRPDVVWFGESLPRTQLEAAVEAARSCDIFFSIGTSGVVQPAASLAFAAHNHGAVVVEINAEPTPLTPKADYVIHGKSGEILPRLLEAVWG